MISFRKHAPESTRRPNSLLSRRWTSGARASRIAVLLILVIAAIPSAPPASARELRQGSEQGRVAEGAAESPKPPARSAQGRTEEAGSGEGVIPIRVTRVETPDGHGFVATIGDFPADLNEAGQEFLKREFFEHFATDVLGLGAPDAGGTLKVSLLPQEKENQREGDFTSGKISGHMAVLVERRRVLVVCTLSETVRAPSLLAGRGRFDALATAAE